MDINLADTMQQFENSKFFRFLETLTKIKFGIGTITTEDHEMLRTMIHDLAWLLDMAMCELHDTTNSIDAKELMEWKKFYQPIMMLTKD